MDGYSYKITVDTNGNVILESLAKNAQKADAAMGELTAGAQVAAEGVTTLGNRATRTTSTLGGMKRMVATLGLTMSAGLMVKNIVSIGTSYEKSMSNVKAITNSTAEEFTRQKQAARDAGAATVFSASESADAMSYLAQAGFKADQQIAALPGTLDLAAAGSLELANAADITANMLAQFGMQASESNIVADQLAFVANSFNTSIAEVAEGMKYFGPTAKSFGVSLAESNAVVGLLANSGLKGSLATRTLSSALIRLTAPTKQMQDVMAQLNLSFFDAKGNFVGLAEMTERLQKATASLNQQQTQAAVSALFGSEAVKDINVLMSEGADKIRYWTEELNAAAGTAERVANTKLDNLYGDFQELSSVAEEFTLKLYDELQPTLRSIAQEAMLMIQNLDVKDIASQLGSLAKGLYSVGSFLAQNVKTLTFLAKAYVTVRLGITGYNLAVSASITLNRLYGAAMLLLGKQAQAAAVGVTAVNTAVKVSPIGLIVGAISAAATAFGLFASKADKATEAQQRFNQQQEELKTKVAENSSLYGDTLNDVDKYNAGLLTGSQVDRMKSTAQMRLDRLEDIYTDVSQSALANDRYNELAEWEKEALAQNDSWSAKRWKSEKQALLNYITRDIAPGLDYAQLKYAIEQNRGLASLSGSSGSSNSSIPGASELSENIVKGGTSQKIINITVHKFQETLNNVFGNGENWQGKADEVMSYFNEAFMRVINSANQIA